MLLARDTRRRLRAERDLADALAFRKAMEDSLVTGLRARDLQGRITYVNPAFCEMVGFARRGAAGAGHAARPTGRPSWRTNTSKRQEVRLAGRHAPPREGFESVFMRKDGTRFPVLIFEAPLINARRAADRLDERLPRHQRAAPHRGAVARQPGAAAGHARGWPRSARWPRCSATN